MFKLNDAETKFIQKIEDNGTEFRIGLHLITLENKFVKNFAFMPSDKIIRWNSHEMYFISNPFEKNTMVEEYIFAVSIVGKDLGSDWFEPDFTSSIVNTNHNNIACITIPIISLDFLQIIVNFLNYFDLTPDKLNLIENNSDSFKIIVRSDGNDWFDFFKNSKK
jgi:hypothetical protein